MALRALREEEARVGVGSEVAVLDADEMAGGVEVGDLEERGVVSREP